MSCPPSELRERNEPKGGVGVETEGSCAEVPVRWDMMGERARAPVLYYSEPSRAERSRPDGGKLAVVSRG